MPAPKNMFKSRLLAGDTLIGCWMDFAEACTTEVMGTAGFDWLVIDGEHGPNDVRSIRDQLMVLEGNASHPVVRVPIGETWIIKQALDAGAQTVLVPMVESADQARELVRACTYPPTGTRGVGGAGARATRFSGISDYVTTADAQICLLVQVENRAGLAELDAILAVDGVHGVFIGPADLAADLGYPGNSGAPEVEAAIKDAIERIAAAGKAPGILGLNDTVIQTYLDWGARFVAVGIDVLMLANTARATAKRWMS
jgi:4-hydroxy-2-oxoheptanedioate aldolase